MGRRNGGNFGQLDGDRDAGSLVCPWSIWGVAKSIEIIGIFGRAGDRGVCLPLHVLWQPHEYKILTEQISYGHGIAVPSFRIDLSPLISF